MLRQKSSERKELVVEMLRPEDICYFNTGHLHSFKVDLVCIDHLYFPRY